MALTTVLFDLDGTLLPMDNDEFTKAYFKLLAKKLLPLGYDPNAQITLEITDSTDGLNAAMQGECDLAMSSRSLASYEEELLESYVIAADGIAVIVNAENPLTDISLSRLKTIYDGDISVWSELE